MVLWGRGPHPLPAPWDRPEGVGWWCPHSVASRVWEVGSGEGSSVRQWTELWCEVRLRGWPPLLQGPGSAGGAHPLATPPQLHSKSHESILRHLGG